MVCRRSEISIPRLTLVVLTCVLFGNSLATMALASCGDYLANSKQGDLRGAQDHSGPESIPPCRGPSCRQAPDRPPLPMPQRVVFMPARDALGLQASSFLLHLDSTFLTVATDGKFSSFCGLPLFRPPRA
jgi:hypothetical protein